jgi:hypothetical protein
VEAQALQLPGQGIWGKTAWLAVADRPFWVPRLPFDESLLLLQQINVASAAKSSCSENLGGLMVLQLFCSQHCLSMR